MTQDPFDEDFDNPFKDGDDYGDKYGEKSEETSSIEDEITRLDETLEVLAKKNKDLEEEIIRETIQVYVDLIEERDIKKALVERLQKENENLQKKTEELNKNKNKNQKGKSLEEIISKNKTKEGLDGVDLSKLKGRRNRRNSTRKKPTSLKDVAEEQLKMNEKNLENQDSVQNILKKLKEGSKDTFENELPTEVKNMDDLGTLKFEEKIHEKALGILEDSLLRLEEERELAHLNNLNLPDLIMQKNHGDLFGVMNELSILSPTSDKIIDNIAQAFGISDYDSRESLQRAIVSSNSIPDVSKIQKINTRGISGEIFEMKEAINTLKANLQTIENLIKGDSSTQQPSIEELEENIKYLEEGISTFSVSLESLRKRKDTDYGDTFVSKVYKSLEKGDIDDAFVKYDMVKDNPNLGDNLSLLENISKAYDIPLIDEVLAPEDFEEQIKRKHEEGFVPDFSYIFDNYNDVDDEIQKYEKGIENLKKELEEKKKLLGELKQAQEVKEESEKVDEEIENVAEELSNDPVYNKEGEFVGNTATTILSDGTEGDIDGLTWDDVIYNPETKEYINRHTGEVVEGRPKYDEDPEKKAKERNERLKGNQGLYSSVLETMGAGKKGVVVKGEKDKDYTVVDLAQERANEEFNDVMGEIEEEINEAYEKIHNLSEVAPEYYSEQIAEEKAKLQGLFNLSAELNKFTEKVWDDKKGEYVRKVHREDETPGTFRAIKDAYEEAGYKSEIGEGLGQAVHHLEGYNWKVGDRIDPNNLILLSKEIHDEFHRIFGAGNNTIEQFVEFLKEYHPEELPKFMERYGDKLGIPQNITDKLNKEKGDWDEDLYRKQYNRWDKLQWIKDFDIDKDKALDMAYSNFFLKDIEIPVEPYQIGDRIFQSKRMASSNEDILDVYEAFVKNDWKRFDDMDETQLAHVLNSRLTVEALNGIIGDEDVIDIEELKTKSRDELLDELDKSQMRGRKVLEDTVSGKRKFSFLDEEFSNGEGENPFADTGLGKGLIPVINELKEFFDKYSVSFGMPNPFDGWDATGDISPGSRNVEILNRLFNVDDLEDGFNANHLLTRVIANLPVKGGRPITNTSDPKLIRDRIRDFNEEYYDTIEEKGKPDKDMLDFRNAKNNLAYLLGIGRNGVSTETINRFFSPRGARKPLSDKDVALSFDFVPAISTDTDKIDADLADMYEALGFKISIGERGGLVLAKDLQREGLDDSDTRDWIFNLPPDAVVMVNSSKSETRTSVDEENDKAIRSVIGETDESKKRTSKSGTFGCCEEIINKLGEIDKVLRDIASLVSDTIDLFSNEMWNRIINGGNSGGSNNSQKQEREPYKGSYRSGQNYKAGYYDFRVKELEELINTTEDDVIKDFAEKALKYANPLNKKGFDGEVKQQDLILALFGKFPDFSNTSAEEWDTYASNLKVIRERWSGITTQEYKDKKLAEIDEKIKTAQIRKEYTGGSEYDKKIARLKAEKERLLAKEVVGEDIYKYIDLLKKAYEAVVQGPAPFENYYDELNNLIISIDREDTKREGLTRNRIKSMEEGIKEADKDVTEQVDRALGKIERMLKIYRGDLRKDIPVDEKADIREKIDKLNELKSHLTGEEVEEEENPYSKYGQFNSNIPHPSEESVDNETWQNQYDINTEQLKLKEEIERLKELKKTIKSETTKSLIEEQIRDKQARYDKLKVLPSDVYDHIEHEKSESHADIFDTRWNFLREQFAKNKERLEHFQGLSSDLLGEDWIKEEYEETLKKLEKIKTAIHTLRGEDGYDYDKHEGAINRIGGEFEKVAISIDEAIRKAKEFEREVSEGVEDVEERNRVGLGHLFGEDFEWNKDGTAKVPNKPSATTEKAPLEGRLTRMAYNFRQASQSANQFSGVLTKLFAIVGSGNAINDMITASSLRQTNQIMLASRRGMEEAKKLYDRIQMLVVKLPGNDTFLTNILTMLGTMDESLTAKDLEYMGGVIADYYMGAQAKGQFNNETERELRNYLMTGQTRNLTNSIIASEIESLKNLNSVKERTVALEKALKKTGMDSIAHYDSYTNSLEEFKGRFQKAFADLGDVYLGFLQGGMKVYNFLDSLTNSALSQFVIMGAVTVMGILAFVAVMAELLSMSAGLVESFDALNKLIRENDKAYSGLAQTFRKVVTWIAYKTGVVNADTASKVINTNVTLKSALVEGVYGRIVKGTISAKIKSIATNAWETLVKYKNAYATYAQATAMGRLILLTMEGNEYKRIATIINYKEAISRAFNTLSMWIENKTLKENTERLIENTREKIKNYLLNLKDTAVKWAGVIANMALYGSTLLVSGALAILNFMLSPIGLVIVGIVVAVWLLIKAFEALGQAFGWWDNIGEMFQAIGDGIRRTWEAFINSEPVQEIIKAVQNLAYTLEVLFNWIGSVAGNIWQTIFGVDDGSKGEVFDIVGVFLEVVGAIGKVLYLASPLKVLVDILNAIGSTIAWFLDTWNEFVDTQEFQDMIKGFQEIRKVIGDTWNLLSQAFGEVKDAFMSIFESDGNELEKTTDDVNVLLEVLRAIAWIINNTIIPLIKGVAYFLKGVAIIIKTIADVISGVIDFFTNTGDYFNSFLMQVRTLVDMVVQELLSIPERVVNSALDGISGGLYSVISEIIWGSDNPETLNTGKQLAQSYNNQITNSPNIVNNHFYEGSVQADARNMTAKDVLTLFTNAFGFNKARGVNGVIN